MRSISFQAFLIFWVINWPSNPVNCVVAEDRPVIQPILVPSNLVEKRKVLLHCQTVQGRPPISFEWQFNGQKIVSNDNVFFTKSDEDLSTLTIRSLNFESIGNYTCIAKNEDLNLFDANTVNIEFNCKILCGRLFKCQVGTANILYGVELIVTLLLNSINCNAFQPLKKF